MKLLLALLFYSGFSAIYSIEHTVAWNSQNMQFKGGFIGDADSVVLRVKPLDSIKFECPTGDEYLVIYRVNEMSFLNCLLEHDAVEVTRCDDPSKLKEHKIRIFSPVPSNFQYEAGRSYYFISTSQGTEAGIEQRSNGLCRRENIRMRLDIQEMGMNDVIETTTKHYQTHPRRVPSTPHDTASEIASRVEPRKGGGISGISSALPSTIDEERLRQVIEWASRGMEGTFRYTMNNENKMDTSQESSETKISVDGVNVLPSRANEISDISNHLDESYEGKYYIEETARYSASSSSTTMSLLLLLSAIFYAFN